VARALRRARTETVGLVITETGQPVFAEMVRGAEQEARAAGFTLLIANSAEDRGRELASVRALRNHRVDGLVLAQVSGSPHSLIETLVGSGLPVVLLDRLSAPDIDQVGVDNIEPMMMLVRHLIRRGHKRIALFAGDDNIPTLRERRLGYLRALAEAGLAVDPRLMVGDIFAPPDARQAVHQLFADLGPTPLVAASQWISAGALEGLADLGLSVGSDVPMAIFDEFPHDECRPAGLRHRARSDAASYPSDSASTSTISDRAFEATDRPPGVLRLSQGSGRRVGGARMTRQRMVGF
jgi:LacI family transcriptional regulator